MNEAGSASGLNGGNRDWVRFFSHLTRTLEKHCGPEELKTYLLALRRSSPEPGLADDDKPAVVRFLRRLGLMDADCQVDAILPALLDEVSLAVSRPASYVYGLMRAQVLGIEALSIKPVCGAVPQCKTCCLTKECEFFNNPRKPEIARIPPVERLMAGRDEALSNAELLGLLLFGERATGMEPLVKALLARYGQLRAIFRADPHEYPAMRDMNQAQAVRLSAASALYRRLLIEKRNEIQRVTFAEDLYDRYAPELWDYSTEAAVVVMMNNMNGIIRDAWFCDGSTNVTHVAIADIVKTAICEDASRVALIHNHPSGDTTPSTADIEYTRRLSAACEVLGLFLVDHVIVSENGFYSFREKGALGL